MKIKVLEVLKKRSVSRDLVFIMICVIIIVSSALNGIYYYMNYQKEVLNLKEKADELTQDLVRIAGYKIYKSEHIDLNNELQAYGKKKDVVSIKIQDNIHDIIFRSQNDTQGPVITIRKPISLFNRSLGNTEIVYSVGNIIKKQKAFLILTITLTVITVLIIGIVLILISEILLRKPYSVLVDGIGYITDGKYERRLPPMKYHYMNMISKSVNRLAEEIMTRKQNLITYQNKLRSLTQELLTVEERERRHIAYEIHDRVGHSLANITIKLGFLKDNINDLQNKKILNDIAQIIKQTNRDVQSLIFEISPPMLYDIGIIAAIEWLIRKIKKDHELIIELKYDDELRQISQNLQVFIFRAIRELLFNVVKHAKASKVELGITRKDGNLMVSISDDGVGFINSKSPTEQFGLFSIKERLSLYDGQLIIHSEPNKGTVVLMKMSIGKK